MATSKKLGPQIPRSVYEAEGFKFTKNKIILNKKRRITKLSPQDLKRIKKEEDF